MKKGKGLRILGILLTVLGAAGIVAFSLAGSSMIVALGVRTISALSTASYITAGVGVAALAAGTGVGLAGSARERSNERLIENIRREKQERFSEYAKDSLNPEKTRMRFEQLRLNNPALDNLVERCLTQMDTIDMYQARHKSLLDANEAIYLEDTDKGEEALDRDIIESSLAENEEELRCVDTLLKYSVAYINNYNRNGVSDRRELDAWLKIMKDSMGGSYENR